MQVNVRQARQQLSRLLEAVEHGQRVEITRRGRVVARLAPPENGQAANMRAAARATLRSQLPPATMPSANLVRELRDERG